MDWKPGHRPHAVGYSVRKLLTGLANAALPARMLRINREITNIVTPPITNNHQLSPA